MLLIYFLILNQFVLIPPFEYSYISEPVLLPGILAPVVKREISSMYKDLNLYVEFIFAYADNSLSYL